MIVGYARTSTLDQQAGFDAQLHDLTGAGCERVFQEQVSSVAARPELDAAIDFVREGDVFVVTKLDRLARSVAHLLQIVDRLTSKAVTLRILTGGEAMDTGTATGRMMLQILGAIGEFERSMMLERQKEGIAKAKAEGKYKGRAPTARAKAAEVRELVASGVSVSEAARRLGIHRASAHRILAAA
jgi:DNA invertase Pin-like site-specific DNA recombinase